jgi:hypothetical protein
MGRRAGERRGDGLKPWRAGMLAVAALGLLPLAAPAADPPKSPPPAKTAPEDPSLDEDLLEFLGTIDSEDEDWIDYLTQTDIEKVAARKRPPVNPDATEVKK